MCHDSMIEFIALNEEIKEMTTAGADGYIKFWNLDVMSFFLKKLIRLSLTFQTNSLTRGFGLSN